MEVRFANAPISWGVNEFGIENGGIKPETMLEELKLAGYCGSELGDYGFFPTDKNQLSDLYKQKNLDMIGAFCCYSLSDPKEHEKGRQYARQVAENLAVFKDSQKFPPHIVLSDSVQDPERIEFTGRITKSMMLDDEKWKILVNEVEYLEKMIWDEYGIRVTYHPHCGTYVETPWEIESLLKNTSSMKLIFDTAHITMGAHARPLYLFDLLKNYPDRIHSFHFKDYDSNVSGKDYFELVQNGCFPELGKGIVDFTAVKNWQEANKFNGWVVVEQDILTGGTDKNEKSSSSVSVINSPLQSAIRNMTFLRNLYANSGKSSRM